MFLGLTRLLQILAHSFGPTESAPAQWATGRSGNRKARRRSKHLLHGNFLVNGSLAVSRKVSSIAKTALDFLTSFLRWLLTSSFQISILRLTSFLSKCCNMSGNFSCMSFNSLWKILLLMSTGVRIGIHQFCLNMIHS